MVKLISKQIAVSTLEPSIRLDDVLRSYDLEDTQFEIKVLNEDLDLTDATIHCVTKYFSHGKSYAFEKLIKPKSKDVVVFSLPEELKGYDGKIYVGLYAELGDERVDIKDIEVTINNSIIDDDIDFNTVNYFESFERMVEKVDLATEDALDNIKHDKEHVALSRDYAERKMDEDIEEVDTRAKEVLESINDKDKKVNELADKLNTDIEDFEQTKITAKEVSDNAVREISQTKDTAISEIESVSDSFKAKKTEFDTVVNGITTSIDAKIKDLDTYTNEQKLHIDEKTKSFNTLVDEKAGELTQLNNTFNQELEKAGVTLTTAQDLINRIGTLEQKEDKDTIYDDSEIKQKIAEIEANAPAVHLAYADSEDGSVGFTKFKPPIVLGATFLDSTKRFVGMSVKDSNDYRDYIWLANPELAKNWQYYEMASTVLDDCNKEYSSLYNFKTVSAFRATNGAVFDMVEPYFILKQKEQNSNNVINIIPRGFSSPVFSFIAEQDGQFDNDWYLVDANDNKMYIRSGLNIFMASPKAIGKDGDIVNPLKIRNTLLYSTNGLIFNFALTQDEMVKITTIAHNTYTQKFTLYQKIMGGIVLYAYPQGSVVLMRDDRTPSAILKRGNWSKLGEIALTNPDGKLYAYVRVL